MRNIYFSSRKVLICGVILAMLSQIFAFTPLPAKANILGDIDDNGQIQTYDAALITQYVASIIDFTDAQKVAADANGDGKISSLDAHVIGDYAVGNITSLPAHYLQYTQDDSTTDDYFAYCDAPTDCVSSTNSCYNSDTNPWPKYICKSDGSPGVGKWYSCADSSHLGKEVMGYTCQEQPDGSYAWMVASLLKPDLTIKDFSWRPASPLVGESDPYLYVDFTVTNKGSQPISLNGTTYSLYRNNTSDLIAELFAEKNQPTLQPGETYTYQNLTTTQNSGIKNIAGTFNLIMKADSENIIVESNENNNTLTKTLVVGEQGQLPDLLPDLIVKNIKFNQKWSIWDNVLTAEVCNQGLATVSGKQLSTEFKLMDIVRNHGMSQTLDPGSCHEVFIVLSGFNISNLSKGYYDVTVTADTDNITSIYDNLVEESNENNNSTSARLYFDIPDIHKPDLKIENFKFTDLRINKSGWDVQISFDLVNAGSVAPSSDFKIIIENLTANKVLKNENYAHGYFIPGHRQKVYTVGNVGDGFTAGSNTIRIKIDLNNTVDESNESNNTLLKTINLPASFYYLQYTRDDGTTAPYHAYCGQPTDCVSSSNDCYDSGTRPFANKRYICQSDTSNSVGKWYRCADSTHAGKTVIGYTCQKMSNGAYGWEKGTNKPDLVVREINYNDGYVGAKVCNDGTAKTESYSSAGLFLGNNYFMGDLLISPLDPGKCSEESAMRVTNYGYDNQTVEAKVVADYYNKVDESNENNNTLTKTITIIDSTNKPDLVINDVYFTPFDPAAGEVFDGQVLIEIENLGKVAAKNFPVVVVLSSNWILLDWHDNHQRKTVDYIGSHATKVIAFDVKDNFVFQNKPLELRAWVDSNGVLYSGNDLENLKNDDLFIDESNENNNTFLKKLTLPNDPGKQITLNNSTYTLNPSSLTQGMTDGAGNVDFKANIIQKGEARMYGFSAFGYGEGFPTYATLGTASGGAQPGNYTVKRYFNDDVLSADGELPRLYSGYLPIAIFHGNGRGDDPKLRFDMNLTVNPPSLFEEPKLTVSATNPLSQQVVPGTSDVNLGNFVFDAVSSSQDIRVTRVDFNQLVSRAGTLYNISMLKLFDGDTELNSSSDPDPMGNGYWATSTFAFSSPLIITKGTVKNLTLRGNISSTAKDGDTHQFIINTNNNITANDNDSGDTVKANGAYPLNGTQLIVGAGKLSISRSDTLKDSLLNGNTTGVTIGKFKAQASVTDINIEKLYLDFSPYHGGGTDELTGVYLYDGATQIAESTITSSNAQTLVFNMGHSPLTVPADTAKELTIKVDTSMIDKSGVATTGTPFEGFTPSIKGSSIVAKETSGRAIQVENNTITFPNYILVKSQPTITKSSAYDDGITSNGTYDLTDVTVSADSKGPVGLYKMTFDIHTTNVSLSDFGIYEGNLLVANEADGATDGINITVVDANHSIVEVYFNSGDSLDGRARTIPAGTSKVYTLKASVLGYQSNVANGTEARILSDDNFATTTHSLNASEVDASSYDNFIWSDLSYGNTSTTATTTKQWLNSYLVRGLSKASSGGGGGGGTPVPIPTPTPDIPLPTPDPTPPTSIAKRLAGRLLLAVENKGRIHYVYPIDLNRYEVTFGNVMKLFEDLSLGISNDNLYQILVNPSSESADSDRDGDGFSDKEEATNGYNPDVASDPTNRGNDKIKANTVLSNRLIGRLLIQVEGHGRIWYVDQSAKRWEVTFGNVMNLFTSLALGITNDDLDKIPAGN